MINRDFTYHIYRILLETFIENHYSFCSFKEYLVSGIRNKERVIILRHDVDRDPLHSLDTALIENELKITGTYYFRIGRESNQPEIIKDIINLGHEIGYHYEDLSICKGDFKRAIEKFSMNLEYFRQFYPVQTICMHGSPLSKYNNKDIWTRYEYKEFGILGEPYFDLDFKKLLYLTDTGRTWNPKYSLRDTTYSSFKNNFHSTFDIINALENNILPNEIMITIHPQRWDDSMLEWLKEFTVQKTKNIIKLFLKRAR